MTAEHEAGAPSIAASFRAKWKAIVDAADKSSGDTPDSRYTACYQAAEKDGFTLLERAVVGGFIEEMMALRLRAETAEAKVERLTKEPSEVVTWIIGFVLGDGTPGEYDDLAREALTAFLRSRTEGA